MDARSQCSHGVLAGCCFPSSGSWDSPQTRLRPQRSGDSLGTAHPILGLESPEDGRRKVLAGVLEHPKNPASQHPVLGLWVPIPASLGR